MRAALLLASYLVSLSIALPALAQLGPAGVPGAPGLAPESEPEPEQVHPVPEPAQPPPASSTIPIPPEVPRTAEKPRSVPSPKVPAACAKAKNVERCIARQERKRQAKAACKGKKDQNFDQCVSNYLNRRTPLGEAGVQPSRDPSGSSRP
jgi:outer membrane biosynthesis protein TonB